MKFVKKINIMVSNKNSINRDFVSNKEKSKAFLLVVYCSVVIIG